MVAFEEFLDREAENSLARLHGVLTGVQEAALFEGFANSLREMGSSGGLGDASPLMHKRSRQPQIHFMMSVIPGLALSDEELTSH
ncbi:MAG: hypothetical protein IT365_24275 [Candidatus Hydrogenedentes bacterium]|nr:hypothetical protein [Candidatus Hydrogenedentota bacterium]